MIDSHEAGGAVTETSAARGACAAPGAHGSSASRTAPRVSTRLSRRIALGGLVALLLVIGGAWMAQSKPSWWRPPANAIRGGVIPRDEPSPAAAGHRAESSLDRAFASDEQARALEQGLAGEFTRVRPAGERWAIRVREADANAWLARRLPLWLAHDRALPWPKGIDLVQVNFASPDRLTVGVERQGWIWSATLRPRLAKGGSLTLEPSGGAVGRLWLPWLAPASSVSEGDSSSGAPNLASFVPELARPVEAIFPLPDGRRVQLLDFELDRGEARLQFVTLPR